MVSRSASVTTVISVIIIFIIIVFLYYYFNPPPPPPPESPNTSTDCSKYGIDAGYATCPQGSVLFEGVCYQDTWPDNLGTKGTLISKCKVNYPDCSRITGCTTFRANVFIPPGTPPGTPCNKTFIPDWDQAHYGDGWYVSYDGILSPFPFCRRGGTQNVYCQSVGELKNVGVCAEGDQLGGKCYNVKCETLGKVRTGTCSCSG